MGNMSVAIMQPYFFPYIGYFQLIAAVDKFVIYDNIKYTKKGWINRNRILLNSRETMLSLPLKKGSDASNICNRELATEYSPDKLLNQLKEAYRSAPYFNITFPLLEKIIHNQNTNLFQYLYYSLVVLCEHLDISTEIIISSEIVIDHELKNQDKVIAICEAVGASTYVNPIGGLELYTKDIFLGRGVELKFIKSLQIEYPQQGGAFIPWLSIIDVLMFNSIDSARIMLGDYHLI